MRARGIKPGFFKNEALGGLPALARLLYIGLWCLADREGRLEDRPKRIKAELFPYDNCNIEKLLDTLVAGGFIRRYGSEDEPYIDIPKFKMHQNPHKNETASVIPAYNDIGTLREDSSNGSLRARLSSSLIPSSLTPDSGLLTASSLKAEKPLAPEIDNELLDELLDMAAGVRSTRGLWKPSEADRKSLAALAETFPPEQLRRELGKFKAYAPQKDWTLFGRAFVSWMGRVKPDPMVAPRPTARSLRITNARAQYSAGMDEGTARAMVLDDQEWQEVMAGMPK